MIDLISWSNTKRAVDNKTMSERFAELLVVNGNTTNITRIGHILADGNKYGRLGLDLSEALELANMTGQILILKDHYPQMMPEFQKIVKSHIEGPSIQIVGTEDAAKILKLKPINLKGS